MKQQAYLAFSFILNKKHQRFLTFSFYFYFCLQELFFKKCSRCVTILILILLPPRAVFQKMFKMCDDFDFEQQVAGSLYIKFCLLLSLRFRTAHMTGVFPTDNFCSLLGPIQGANVSLY